MHRCEPGSRVAHSGRTRGTPCGLVGIWSGRTRARSGARGGALPSAAARHALRAPSRGAWRFVSTIKIVKARLGVHWRWVLHAAHTGTVRLCAWRVRASNRVRTPTIARVGGCSSTNHSETRWINWSTGSHMSVAPIKARDWESESKIRAPGRDLSHHHLNSEYLNGLRNSLVASRSSAFGARPRLVSRQSDDAQRGERGVKALVPAGAADRSASTSTSAAAQVRSAPSHRKR